MAFPAGTQVGDSNVNGAGGPASGFGKTRSQFSNPGTMKPTGPISLKSVSDPFRKDSAGKLSKTGASTRSESLARLRGKGALA